MHLYTWVKKLQFIINQLKNVYQTIKLFNKFEVIESNTSFILVKTNSNTMDLIIYAYKMILIEFNEIKKCKNM